ncbi:Gfo/Idh/MocA family protein [Galbibacter mesophilus]|uniref:Gfo/Idh/MocA family protein n=1 Tax=Galbibacter mesophilus TaxID=379069 RepID=UPI00191E4DD2|nr:Gfo/Idh/MocA family oxidoreductase [Galbibacter mesophilus]MCM5663829.1 Gfo/Idh/MocA family oxidoreductase [Galbibacter mesophilus]
MSFYINRRHFLKSAAAATIFSAYGAYGHHLMFPSKKLKVGLIGTGWYGKNDLLRLIQVTDVEVVALCDVDKNMLNEASELISRRNNQSKRPALFTDYRTMLSSEEMDVVLIGTPDHWHALNTIEALQAGCHVYVQKPTGVDVMEGEAMVKATQKYNKVVQVGLQRRSTPHLIDAKENIIDKGLLGKIGHVEMCCYYHMRANGTRETKPIPNFFDYDMWCGPAPKLDYTGLPHRSWWRSHMEYGNGIMGDMCVHMLDAVRWMLGLGWPIKIQSQGGIFVQKGGFSNIADTQTAIFEYEDFNCVWNHRSWGRPDDPEYPWAFFIHGEKGVLKASVKKYEFISTDGKTHIKKDVVYEREKFPEDVTEKNIELHVAPATRGHMMDFLSAIDQGKKPVASIEQGHISSASCIIANLAMKLERPLRYNPATRKFLSDDAANALLARKYREGWQHPFPEDFS